MKDTILDTIFDFFGLGDDKEIPKNVEDILDDGHELDFGSYDREEYEDY